ncbi:hypothetical protein PybrP1_008618 [[Pythium] brassicae (nom. inval.)]|nr:hypothetical protein PybrP1_008618 [[Pythium] brassicae (nom. inval.)]
MDDDDVGGEGVDDYGSFQDASATGSDEFKHDRTNHKWLMPLAAESPFVVHDAGALPAWNLCVAAVALLSLLFAHVYFRSFPRSSSRFEDESIVSDVQLQDEYDWTQWYSAFAHDGFWNTVLAFSVAECVVNAISALLGKFLRAEGYSKPEVGVIGAAFIASTLVGGHAISQYVDRERKHTRAMKLCLALIAISMAAFKLTLSVNGMFMFASLMAVGAFLGPLQPVALELGVECAFPTSEATVAALQQLCGNLLSAVLVPGLSALRRSFADASGRVPHSNGEYKRFRHESGLLLPFTANAQRPRLPAPLLVKQTKVETVANLNGAPRCSVRDPTRVDLE